MQTRDQQYASDACQRVSAFRDQNEHNEHGKQERNRYGSMSHRLPILIHTAGLAQALSFVEAKSKKQPVLKQFLEDLDATVGHVEQQTLPQRAREAGLSEYIHLTQRTLDALLWYKRFAQSILDVDASDMDNDEGGRDA